MTTPQVDTSKPVVPRAPRGEAYRIAELDEIVAGQTPTWRDYFINNVPGMTDPVGETEKGLRERTFMVKAAKLYASLSDEGKERAVRVLTNTAAR